MIVLHPVLLRARRFVSGAFVAFSIALLAMLAGPGIQIARAETDLAPSADELLRGSTAQRVPVALGSSCDPQAGVQARADVERQRQAVLAQMQRLMGGSDDPGQMLRNGYGYAAPRSITRELGRIEREVGEARAARP